MTTFDVKQAAPLILAEIERAQNILLHLHPSPDEDSVGGALAMYHVLKAIGKTPTLIAGDSPLPAEWSVLPGYDQIKITNYFETDLKEFDLFLILDSGGLGQISRLGEVIFPATLRTAVIDHHPSNPGYGEINLLATTYPANCQVLYDLFRLWKITITHEIALNLLIGIYTDTGGFNLPLTNQGTFAAAADLVTKAPDYSRTLFAIFNNAEPEEIIFRGLALSNIETFLGGHLAMAAVDNATLIKHNIQGRHADTGHISAILRSVKGWEISVCLVEKTPGVVNISFRTRDLEKYDVSKIASQLNGGGHKGAAGGSFTGTIAEAKAAVVAAVSKVYPDLLGSKR